MGSNTFKIVDNSGKEYWLVRREVRNLQQNVDYKTDFLVEFCSGSDVEFTFDTEEEAKEVLEKLIVWLDE